MNDDTPPQRTVDFPLRDCLNIMHIDQLLLRFGMRVRAYTTIGAPDSRGSLSLSSILVSFGLSTELETSSKLLAEASLDWSSDTAEPLLHRNTHPTNGN